MITADHLRKILSYDATTGIFLWRISPRLGAIYPGDRAGTRHHNGYTLIKINKKKYIASRLAWLYITGKWPHGQMDHINGNRSDDRLSNIRDVSALLNAQNRRIPWKSKELKVVGVYRHRDKYRALIRANGKQRHLGIFITKEEAQTAYLEAKRKFHAGCTI